MDGRLTPEDERLTLRVRRGWVALGLALVVHAAVSVLLSLLPTPKKVPERIELSFASAAPAPAPKSTEPPAPEPPARAQPRPPRPERSTPLPTTAPVVPMLPADTPPTDTRAVLPDVPLAPEPAPVPQPSSWKDRLRQQLASTATPSTMFLDGPLKPSFSTLDRVAYADPRMHDEETERRLQVDHGPFFRRGLEALRGQWHPGEVLTQTERDPTRRCGRTTRTTFAVAVLDRQGNVVDVEVKNPSGCPDLDDEAVAAFKRVARFPHPPEGIFISPEGEPMQTARYPVRFIVTFDGGLRLDWRG